MRVLLTLKHPYAAPVEKAIEPGVPVTIRLLPDVLAQAFHPHEGIALTVTILPEPAAPAEAVAVPAAAPATAQEPAAAPQLRPGWWPQAVNQEAPVKRCKYCERPIWWGRTQNGSPNPYDVGEDGARLAVSHWTTCPKAGEARKAHPRPAR